MGQFRILIASLMLTKQRSVYENTNTTNFRDIQRDQIVANHAICPYDTQKPPQIRSEIGLRNICMSKSNHITAVIQGTLNVMFKLCIVLA